MLDLGSNPHIEDNTKRPKYLFLREVAKDEIEACNSVAKFKQLLSVLDVDGVPYVVLQVMLTQTEVDKLSAAAGGSLPISQERIASRIPEVTLSSNPLQK